MATWYEDGLRGVNVAVTLERMGDVATEEQIEPFCEALERELAAEFGENVQISTAEGDGHDSIVYTDNSELTDEDIKPGIERAWERACEAV